MRRTISRAFLSSSFLTHKILTSSPLSHFSSFFSISHFSISPHFTPESPIVPQERQTSTPPQNPQTPISPQIPNIRSRTPLEKQFDSWVTHLRPGFSPSDVVTALQSQSDPDLAHDIFRWTAQQRGYRHDAAAYQTMIEIAASGKRFSQVETLIDEVVAGACSPSLTLYNSIISFCCSRRHLFNRAFEVFRKLQRFEQCKPTLETYSMLLNCLLRRFSRLNVCYVYLHSVRSLLKQMKASGVIPDTFTLNLIVKAYSKCLEMDEAMRIFREMRLYACEPDNYTYGYITKGLCEKGRVEQGFGFFKEMREKGFVPNSSTYMILICSLSMERRFEDAVKVLYDMLNNSMAPDLLTYRTLLEGLCREGRSNDAFGLLEELRKKEGSMDEKIYSSLLDGLNLLRRDY